MMTENRTIQLAEIPIGGEGGAVWNRLHGEREELCEALLKDFEPAAQAHQREQLLQARLRTIDDALDRLMSGAYGFCSKCGHPIEGATLDADPAWALCLNCRDRDVIVENLDSFDTILVRTQNSDYRILLLDPKTGRALVEGGSCVLEPSDGLIQGSALPGSVFKPGALCIGGRLEMWVNERLFLTSPIEAVEVNHNSTAELPESLSAATH